MTGNLAIPEQGQGCVRSAKQPEAYSSSDALHIPWAG